MEIRAELKNAYRLAKELAVGWGKGKAEARIVTVEDDKDEPWAEVKVEFVDGEPQTIKVRTGSTIATKEWINDEHGLESIEYVISEIQNYLIVNLIWLGD